MSFPIQKPILTPRVHRVKNWNGVCIDGIPFIAISVFFTVVLGFIHWGISIPFVILSAFIAWFFRDPEREIPENEAAILSPADGTIIDICTKNYPRLLQGEATRISIFMSVLNVHVNRIPCSGSIRQIQYNPGKFFVAHREKASLDNEQTAIVIDTKRGGPILLIQIAGLIARRIVCRLTQGEAVQKGEKYGLIRFGSRCDLYLPKGVHIQAKVGDSVKGGETVLGVFS